MGTEAAKAGIESASVIPTMNVRAITIQTCTQPVSIKITSSWTRHSNRLGGQDHLHVIQGAAKNSQHPGGRVHCECIQTEQNRRSAQAQDKPGFCDLLHPHAQVRKQTPHPEGPEALGPKQGQRLGEGSDVLGVFHAFANISTGSVSDDLKRPHHVHVLMLQDMAMIDVVSVYGENFMIMRVTVPG